LDEAADFPAESVADAQFAEISAVVDLIEQLTAQFTASFGGARFGFSSKAAARERLRERISEIAALSRSMTFEIPGIELKFRVQNRLNDANLLALGNAFYQQSETYKDNFIRYGLNASFRDDLKTAIEAFDRSFGAPVTSVDGQVAATAQINEAVRRGMIARKILDGVVKIKYKNNVGKLRAWTSASHIEQKSSNSDENNPDSQPNG
jgi:hypothetical protein